jgi:membrane-bound lytic murein transglycosylase D
MGLVRLYAFIALCAIGILGSTSCHTAQKPASLLPPTQSTPPAITTGAPATETSNVSDSLAIPNSDSPTSSPPVAKSTAKPKQASSKAVKANPKQHPTVSKQTATPKAQSPSAPAEKIVTEAQAPAAHPVQTTTQTPALEAQPDSRAVNELIAQVEKEYRAGQENYSAGHLEAAKQNFDRAFNLLLGSNLDIRSDDRLQSEFDKILDGVNGLELLALQEGDGFTQQKSEPAPIEEANEVTFPVDQTLKAQAEAEIKSTRSDLPLMMTDPVASYINYFSSRGRSVLEGALARAGRYQDMMQRILRQEGVPQDLIYLAQAESGFHPLALSRTGARGMWQLMASRAQGYGLRRNWWEDERQDPEKATRAAARHLHDLYRQFGDWYLAMAAYNSGPITVQNAVKRTGYADFWEMYRRNVLPRETRNYVPIILAVTIMAKNPEQYGLDKVQREKPLAYDAVKINYPVDLRLVAECVDASAADLQDLNPSLLRMTTPKGKEFDLHLPVGTKDKYLSAIAGVPLDMRVWWRYHKVQPGDTLASLAHAYRTTPKAIAAANYLEGEQLEADGKLLIPIAAGKHAVSEDGATYSRRITRYKVHRGETVQTVAENVGVPPTMIRRWNHLKGSSLRGRTVLFIHLPVTPNLRESPTLSSKSSKRKGNTKKPIQAANDENPVVRHKVKRGETLSSIATSYKTTVDAIKRDNRNVATLRPGMVLLIHEVR